MAVAADKDEEAKKVDFKVYDGYFQSNKAGLAGKASYLVFRSRKDFDKVFRPVPPLLKGKKKTMLPDDIFKASMVVAVIKRGNSITTYRVKGVRALKGKITLAYEAKAGPETTAEFASPLIVSIPRGTGQVVFEENGKAASTVAVPKEKID
jgi:hypothetical protein